MERLMSHRRRPSIDVFQLVPTESYVEQHFGGSTKAFWDHMRAFEQRFVVGLDALVEKYNWEVGGDRLHHYAVKPRHTVRDSLARLNPLKMVRTFKEVYKDVPSSDFFFYRALNIYRKQSAIDGYTQLVSQQQRPLNLLGIGLSARSHIFGRASFQYFDPTDDPATPGQAVYRGQYSDAEIEYRTYLITQFRDAARVNAEQFEEIFGLSLEGSVGQPLAALKVLGLMEQDAEGYILKTDTARSTALALLWLIPTHYLEFEIARVLGLNLSPEGVRDYFKFLPVNTALANGLQFGGVSEGSLHIVGGGQPYTVRLAPPMESGRPVRFVLDAASRPVDEDIDELKKAIGKLRGYFDKRYGRPGRWLSGSSTASAGIGQGSAAIEQGSAGIEQGPRA
jgi:hypothetical protein